MRIDKYLSDSGLTRTQAKQAVKMGRVAVDGEIVSDPSVHIDVSQSVTVDGIAARGPGHSYIMLNKPSGVVTAKTDDSFRTVFDVLPDDMQAKGLSAVGRLDRDTTGILLFTTDGELAHRLISPNRNVDKVYLAEVDSPLDDKCVRMMAEGVRLKDFTAKPAVMTVISPFCAELTVTEGKYHQVKRMFAALGRNVVKLKRLSVAGVSLDPELELGMSRRLYDGEIERLYKAVGLENAK